MCETYLQELNCALYTSTALYGIVQLQDFGNAIASLPGQEQLQWLHTLHTNVDHVLRGLTATKVDTSGIFFLLLTLCQPCLVHV